MLMSALRGPYYEQMVARQKELLAERAERERQDRAVLERLRQQQQSAPTVATAWIAAPVKAADNGDRLGRWIIRIVVALLLGAATLCMVSFLKQGASIGTAIGLTVLTLVVGLVGLAGAALVVFLVTDGAPTDPDWIRHRHCGDWLHGGRCPDPAWHGRAGRPGSPGLGSTSNGSGGGDGY